MDYLKKSELNTYDRYHHQTQHLSLLHRRFFRNSSDGLPWHGLPLHRAQNLLLDLGNSIQNDLSLSEMSVQVS